jgi:ATP synthase protein I
MEEDDFSRRLEALRSRTRPDGAGGTGSRSAGARKYTQSSLAWRMVIELVAGMLLGLAIGYGLDALFGTRPVFLVVFALFGFAAGVKTMLRTATEVREGRGEAALGRDEAAGGGNGPGAGPRND